MLDGSQRRNTKHESAWPFRIWYNFDRKYPFEPQITYLRACPQKCGCYIHHGHQGGLFTSWEICSNPHLCVQEVYSSPASNTSFQFFVAWTLDVPESAQFPLIVWLIKVLIILDELVLQLPEAPPDPQRSSSHGHSARLLWPAGTMPHQPAGLRGSDTQQTTNTSLYSLKAWCATWLSQIYLYLHLQKISVSREFDIWVSWPILIWNLCNTTDMYSSLTHYLLAAHKWHVSSLLVIIKYLIMEPDRYFISGFDASTSIRE